MRHPGAPSSGLRRRWLYERKIGKLYCISSCHSNPSVKILTYLFFIFNTFCLLCTQIIYLKYPGRDPLRIKSGVENLAYFAPNSVFHYLKKYQTSSNLTTLEFKEGVTTIGTGWEEIRESKSTYTPQVDIYLPSTLKTVNAEAFSRMITMIRNVYVPNGMVETMKSVLPSYLRPYVKERPKSGFINFLKNLFK